MLTAGIPTPHLVLFLDFLVLGAGAVLKIDSRDSVKFQKCIPALRLPCLIAEKQWLKFTPSASAPPAVSPQRCIASYRLIALCVVQWQLSAPVFVRASVCGPGSD